MTNSWLSTGGFLLVFFRIPILMYFKATFRGATRSERQSDDHVFSIVICPSWNAPGPLLRLTTTGQQMNSESLFFLWEVPADALERGNRFTHRARHCLFGLPPPACLECGLLQKPLPRPLCSILLTIKWYTLQYTVYYYGPYSIKTGGRNNQKRQYYAHAWELENLSKMTQSMWHVWSPQSGYCSSHAGPLGDIWWLGHNIICVSPVWHRNRVSHV